jgi:hypothetical protein
MTFHLLPWQLNCPFEEKSDKDGLTNGEGSGGKNVSYSASNAGKFSSFFTAIMHRTKV